MSLHGDCIGPVGAHLYHGACPHTWVSAFTGREHVCSCRCHDANLPKHSSGEPGRIEQADEVRQHPIGSDRPTRTTEQRG